MLKKILPEQIFYENEKWLCFVHAAPSFQGHCVLEYRGKNYKFIPLDFDIVLDEVCQRITSWVKQYRDSSCNIVWYNGLPGKYFKVHIIPIIPQEVDECNHLLWERIPELQGQRGGILYYLGQREHKSDIKQVFLQDKNAKNKIKNSNVVEIANQLRSIQ